MPPLFSITISQPEWVQQAPNTKVTDFNSNNSNDDDDCDGSSSSSSSSNDTEVRMICCKFIYLQVFVYLICT
jgi:hypothetical protein